MQFKVLTTLVLATLAVASPAPQNEEKGFQVVIKYVDAPDCDYACGVKTYDQTTTFTSTNTKYVIVTLQTEYGSTKTLGCQTKTTKPTWYGSMETPDYQTKSAKPTGYETPDYQTKSAEPTAY